LTEEGKKKPTFIESDVGYMDVLDTASRDQAALARFQRLDHRWMAAVADRIASHEDVL